MRAALRLLALHLSPPVHLIELDDEEEIADGEPEPHVPHGPFCPQLGDSAVLELLGARGDQVKDPDPLNLARYDITPLSGEIVTRDLANAHAATRPRSHDRQHYQQTHDAYPHHTPFTHASISFLPGGETEVPAR